MKKWTEIEIYGIGYMLLRGPQVEAFLQDIMKNQNEMIDWIEQTKQKYPDWAKEQIKYGDRPALNRSDKIGGSER